MVKIIYQIIIIFVHIQNEIRHTINEKNLLELLIFEQV